MASSTTTTPRDEKLQHEKILRELGEYTTAVFPSEIRRKTLTYLDVSYMSKQGPLQSLPPNLISLNLSFNNFTSIRTVLDLRCLRILRVEHNCLSQLPPQLPPLLEELYCDNNRLECLPAVLPQGLRILHCNVNKIARFPPLPDTLEELHCSRNQLTAPPDYSPETSRLRVIHCNLQRRIPIWTREFPRHLETFVCVKNGLSSIVAPFPDSLKCLRLYSNRLTHLPNLPPTLEILDCAENELTALPPLPDTVITANLHKNRLRTIQYDPQNSTLESMDCGENQIREWILPLPPHLSEWKISSNHSLIVLPPNLGTCLALAKLNLSWTAATGISLPPNLKIFISYGTPHMMKLPQLPEGLEFLAVGKNNLLELPPKLPPNLVYLDCQENPLTELPELPARLTTLVVRKCRLGEIAAFPQELESADVSENVALRSLPDYSPRLSRLICFGTPLLTKLPNNPGGRVRVDADFRLAHRQPVAVAGSMEFHYQQTTEPNPQAATCPICFELTQDWTCSVVCRHKICSPCFVGFVETTVKHDGEIVCPMCRGDMSCLEWWKAETVSH